MHKSFVDFNKEIIFGELGALIMANLLAYISSHFTSNDSAIAVWAVVGTLLGGSIFWLAARIYDKFRDYRSKPADLAKDISYFTPAAIVLGFLIYDPSIYFVSRYLLRQGHWVETSVIVGQAIAFSLFLFCMNVYRAILRHFKLEEL
ncbi:MAG: hypothetical protein KGI79_01645 [Patescibacteria group bacterium]|nr:hypothetical protein [Patescibacteria group bacterium]MDE2116560.1 hypothetical protein [Patescibacteria group bacterium]